MAHYPNCLDYLQIRGVLPFSVAPFSPADNLILSTCIYLPFERALAAGEWLTFPQAAQALERLPDWDAVGLVMSKDTPALLVQAARSDRFAPVQVGLVQATLEEDTQFAALTYRLPDGSHYVCFRGTDDTLVGWKECFAMSYAFPVPAQQLAQEYLIQAARQTTGPLRVGGHSKGGNLAVWAAVHAPAEVQDRIVQVYSNDGPGFGQDLVNTPAYQALAPRLVTYVPQSSLVGTLLHQDPNTQTIRSHGVGTIGQHDPFSWEVHGTGFLPLDRRSRRGERESAGFQSWVDSLDRQEREEFTEVFFSLLSASRAETLSELSQSWADSALAAVRAYGDLPPQVRRDMLDYLWRFLVSMSTGGAARRES